MNVATAYPPIFDEIAAAFPFARKPGVIFAWGDTIYNPSGGLIPAHLMVHEAVHGRRQGGDDLSIRAWWTAYIHEPEFRLEEEIHAHCAELGALAGGGSRHQRRAALADVSHRLAAPLYSYGRLMNPTKARAILKSAMREAA